MNIILVGLGGFFGAIGRYLLGLIPINETFVRDIVWNEDDDSYSYTSEQIDAIADVYRTIYDSGLNVTQALEEAAKLPASAERDIIIDFVRSSKRGIVRKPV